MHLLTRPTSLIWLALMAITIATTWWLSKDAFSPVTATVATFLLASFKVRLVIIHFMEVGHAPLPVRLFFEAWPVGVAALIIGFYLNSAGLL